MRNLGTVWQAYQDDRAGRGIRWIYERRVIINNSDYYYENEIFDIKKQTSLIDSDFSIGECHSARLDVTIIPHSGIVIPRNAKVQFELRITNIPPGTTTDWVPFGTYYIDYREEEGGRLKLECYDGMMFTDEEFLSVRAILDDYPMPAPTILQHISNIIGIPLDTRNVINAAVNALYPAHLTMREILSFIGSAHGGNFYITDDNKLRLMPVKNAAGLEIVDSGYTKRKTQSDSRHFDKLYMVRDDNGEYFEAGTGNVSLEVLNLFATQTITDSVFAIINAYTYNTFDIQSADINPALELGDPIDVDGIQCNLWVMNWSERIFADISAQTAGDTAREFRFRGTQTSAVKRQMAAIDGKFVDLNIDLDGLNFTVGKNADAINLLNVGLGNLRNDTQADVANLTVSLNGISTTVVTHTGQISTLNQTTTSITTRVATAEGNITTVTQTANKISWVVASGTTSSDFTITPRMISLIGGQIDIRGYVTFTNLGTVGQTSINAGNITTGTIDAANINVINLNINNVKYGTYAVITATGVTNSPQITFGDASRYSTFQWFGNWMQFGTPAYKMNVVVFYLTDNFVIYALSTMISGRLAGHMDTVGVNQYYDITHLPVGMEVGGTRYTCMSRDPVTAAITLGTPTWSSPAIVWYWYANSIYLYPSILYLGSGTRSIPTVYIYCTTLYLSGTLSGQSGAPARIDMNYLTLTVGSNPMVAMTSTAVAMGNTSFASSGGSWQFLGGTFYVGSTYYKFSGIYLYASNNILLDAPYLVFNAGNAITFISNYLGFFGANAISRQTLHLLASGQSTVSDFWNKINDIITALANYGLFYT